MLTNSITIELFNFSHLIANEEQQFSCNCARFASDLRIRFVSNCVGPKFAFRERERGVAVQHVVRHTSFRFYAECDNEFFIARSCALELIDAAETRETHSSRSSPSIPLPLVAVVIAALFINAFVKSDSKNQERTSARGFHCSGAV